MTHIIYTGSFLCVHKTVHLQLLVQTWNLDVHVVISPPPIFLLQGPI